MYLLSNKCYLSILIIHFFNFNNLNYYYIFIFVLIYLDKVLYSCRYIELRCIFMFFKNVSNTLKIF